MGASDSKLQFKNHVFRLIEVPEIPANDPYWAQFWQQPVAVGDVFTLFTASDIRQTRDRSRRNLETFILALTGRLFYLAQNPSFPHPEIAPQRDLLNCVRLLTRVLPFLYEQRHLSQQSDDWHEAFFWGKRRVRSHPAPQQPQPPQPGGSSSDAPFNQEEFDNTAAQFHDAKPLGEQLVDTAFALLFAPGFTVPKSPSSPSPVSHPIWETGVGCTTPVSSTGEQDSNKIEILRFLLALISDSLYLPASQLVSQGSPSLTYMVTQTSRKTAMAILCSLLNTTLKYSPRWKVPYDHMLVSDGHKVLITYSLQLLEALLIYPIPETPTLAPKKNIFRQLCSKIHKVEDLQFIGDSLIKMLSQPIHASFSYLPGSRQGIPWVTELAMLFWDLVQCNKKLKSFLIVTERMYDCLIILLYYIHEKASDPSKINLVRLCAYELLYLTGDPTFAASLSKKFTGQSLLPNAIQLSSFNGSYGDYLIIQLIKTITSQKQNNLDLLVPTFLNCIFNVAPYTKNICYQAASSLVQLCATLSNPSFLFASESNHILLEIVLKSINLMIECNFNSNRNLVFLIVKNERVFLTIKSLTLEEDVERILVQVAKKPGDAKITASYAALDPEFVIESDSEEEEEEKITKEKETRQSQEIEIPSTPRKDKGKGVSDKRPLEQYSNTNNPPGGGFVAAPHWVGTWLPLLPIHTTTSVIACIKETVPYFKAAATSLEARLEPSKAIDAIAHVRSIPGVIFYNTNPPSAENPAAPVLPPDFEVARFAWTSGSLGWYESILWGCIFQAESDVSVSDNSMLHTTSNNCMPVGVWNGTAIKLFRLQEAAHKGPSLLRPKGAVDAVADTMLQKFGQFGLGGTK